MTDKTQQPQDGKLPPPVNTIRDDVTPEELAKSLLRRVRPFKKKRK